MIIILETEEFLFLSDTWPVTFTPTRGYLVCRHREGTQEGVEKQGMNKPPTVFVA